MAKSSTTLIMLFMLPIYLVPQRQKIDWDTYNKYWVTTKDIYEARQINDSLHEVKTHLIQKLKIQAQIIRKLERQRRLMERKHEDIEELTYVTGVPVVDSNDFNLKAAAVKYVPVNNAFTRTKDFFKRLFHNIFKHKN